MSGRKSGQNCGQSCGPVLLRGQSPGAALSQNNVQQWMSESSPHILGHREEVHGQGFSTEHVLQSPL